MNPATAVAVPVSVLVTTTLLEPADPAGVVAVIAVELATVTEVAATPPTVTAAPILNPVPVIVIDVPPSVVPMAGTIVLIVGAEIVVSGDILRFGGKLKLSLRLHETGSGKLLASAVAEGDSLAQLEERAKHAAESLSGAVRVLP